MWYIPILLGVAPSSSPPPPSPSPPLDVFISRDALLGCSRADHILGSYYDSFVDDDSVTHYAGVEYGDTGLHELKVSVDQKCKAAAEVKVAHGDGQIVSLWTSSDEGVVWKLVDEVTLTQSFSPLFSILPSPSPISAPSSFDAATFSSFDATRAPMYVRACINCDGDCNGIDHIDAIVSCYYADHHPPPKPPPPPPNPFPPPPQAPPPPSSPPIKTKYVPWWVWFLCSASIVLLIVFVAILLTKKMPERAVQSVSTVRGRPGSRV